MLQLVLASCLKTYIDKNFVFFPKYLQSVLFSGNIYLSPFSFAFIYTAKKFESFFNVNT